MSVEPAMAKPQPTVYLVGSRDWYSRGPMKVRIL